MLSVYNVPLWGFAVWLLLVAWLWLEASRHRANLNCIRLRIHVNGTRGKSGVTRLIAAGLSAGGIPTVAKTTGSAAMLINPDGSETPVKRRGPANIRELLPCIDYARSLRAQAFVAECMALQPELQWFAEHRLLCSHIGVLTNIRTDHEDIMGDGLLSIAAALANTIPHRGLLVTGPDECKLLAQVGYPLTTEIRLADASKLPPETFEGFPFEVFPQNIALALAVCELAGVSRDTALSGMRKSRPDSGHLTVIDLELMGTNVKFINALAANDPESTLYLYRRHVTSTGTNIVWLHGRSDRRLRSQQLCRSFAEVHEGLFLLSGDTDFLNRSLLKHRVGLSRIYCCTARQELPPLLAGLTEPVIVFAAGNIHGFPFMLLHPNGD